MTAWRAESKARAKALGKPWFALEYQARHADAARKGATLRCDGPIDRDLAGFLFKLVGAGDWRDVVIEEASHGRCPPCSSCGARTLIVWVLAADWLAPSPPEGDPRGVWICDRELREREKEAK